MKFTKARLLLIPFVLAVAFGCGGNSAGSGGDLGTRAEDTGVTAVMAPSPATADGGTVVTWTLTLSAPAVGNETFSLSCSPAGSFSSLPTTATVPSGQSSVTFSSTLANGASGDVSVTGNSPLRAKTGHVMARAMWGE